MPDVAVSTARETTWSLPDADRLAVPQSVVVAVLLVAIVAGALAARVSALATYGFSEDEINKVRAIAEYRNGRFGANAEHPMLMKLAMWTSLSAVDAWNHVAPPYARLGLESAIRLPNAVAGAATTLLLYGLADILFGAPVALMTSLFWAFDVNAIAVNRIGKEDTFLLFFFVLAMWCYERAKQIGAADPARAQRWYAGSGASFGLMLASKYMPHYLGIYALFNTITDRSPGANRPNHALYYGAMACAFVVANAAVLMPSTWRYWIAYVQGGTLQHHGYPFAGRLYVSNVPISPLGVPPTFYLRLLATKVPLVVLGAAVAGVIELVRRRDERGFVLLRVWLVFFLVPYSLMAAKFLRYALPLFAALDVVAAVGVVAGIAWVQRKGWLARSIRIAVSAAALALAVVGPVAAQESASPFYSMFRNAIDERQRPSKPTFPEETYDYGVREAVAAIAGEAEPGSAIVSDATGVVAHYLSRIGRGDLEARSLSAQGIPQDGRPAWVLVQAEHVTFENEEVVAQLRARLRPWLTIRAGDAPAVDVFRLAGRRR